MKRIDFTCYCTPEDARWFFLYQDRDLITERFAELIQADPDDVIIKVDWGVTDGGDMTGGDLYFGPDRHGHYLPEDQLVELAEYMGWHDWIEPWFPPYRMY